MDQQLIDSINFVNDYIEDMKQRVIPTKRSYHKWVCTDCNGRCKLKMKEFEPMTCPLTERIPKWRLND